MIYCSIKHQNIRITPWNSSVAKNGHWPKLSLHGKMYTLLWPLSVCNQAFPRLPEKIEYFLNDTSNVIQIRSVLCFSMRNKFQRKIYCTWKASSIPIIPIPIVLWNPNLIFAQICLSLKFVGFLKLESS